MKQPLQIALLGPLEIRDGAGKLRANPGPKTQALLGYLVSNPGPHTRSSLYDLLCDDAEDPPAALRWHLNRIRRWLGSEVLRADDDRIQFQADAGTADCRAVEQAASAGLESLAVPALAEAADAFRGEFLASLSVPDSPEFELWLIGERARYRRLYERILNELILRRIGQEQYDSAILPAVRLLRSNPILEQAHARLIWLYAKTGQRQAALDQYAQCRDLLRRELEVEPTQELAALAEDVRAGRLGRSVAESRPAETAAWNSVRMPELVGREAEMRALAALWQAAAQGRGAAAFLEAEAGGGKTRLAREFIRSLGEGNSPFRILSGQCYESTRDLPYHPWIELLESQLAGLDSSALAEIPPFWMEQLTRLLPSLASRRTKGLVSSPPTSGGEVEHLFAAVADFLFRLSSDAPLLILLDDLQWADSSSIRLHHYLARRVSRQRVLLLGAFRPEEIEPVSGMQTLLDELRRGPLTELRPPPLDAEFVTALIAQLWPKLPEGYRPHVCALLVKATGGNPLFVTEVLRELSGTADVPLDVPVPPTVQALICRRLGKLSESGRQVLQAIAVLDMPASVPQAQQVSVRSEEEAVSAIEMGLRWGLLKSAAAAHPASYDFSHDLVRETVLVGAGEARRRMLHRRAADMLAEEAGGVAPDSRPEAAARILYHAQEGGVDPLILAWAPAAAERASRLCVYADALHALDAACGALARLESGGGIPAPAANRQRLELTLSRIEVLSQMGRHEDQIAPLQTAAELLEEDPPPKLKAAFLLARAYHLARMSRYRAAQKSAEQAHAHYRRLNDARRSAGCLMVRADAIQSMGENKSAFRLLEHALALYHSSGDRSGESMCLSQIAGVLQDLGRIEDSLEHLNRALALSKENGDLFAEATACSWIGNGWMQYHNVGKILHYAEITARLCRTLENEFKGARAECYFMYADYLRGNWEAARTSTRRIHDRAKAMKDGWLEGWTSHFLGRIALIQGDLSDAGHWLTQARSLREQWGELQNSTIDLDWLGRLSLIRGDAAGALRFTTEAVRRMEALWGNVRIWDTPDILLCHAEALAAAGEAAKSKGYIRRAQSELQKFAGQIRDPGVRREFLAFPVNARILSVYERGCFPPRPR